MENPKISSQTSPARPASDVHIIGADTSERIIRAANCAELKEHGIALIGLSQASHPYNVARINLDSLHFHVCTAGQGLAWVENRWEFFQCGDAYVNSYGTDYALQAVRHQNWSFAWVIYRGIRPWQQRLEKKSLRIPALGMNALSVAIEGLYQETVRNRPDHNLCSAWANLINSYCRRIVEDRPGSGRLPPLWEIVDKTLGFPWTIDSLSSRSGLSREHLRRLAKLETGRTPMAQVTWMRMNRAMALLESRTMKIQAIAETVGYRDPSTFSTAFTRWHGSPPSTFLK